MKPRKKRRGAYVNARDVLPRRLLAMVQERFEGGLLWVPSRDVLREKTAHIPARNRRMILERRRGATIAALARKHGLCEERVRQIVRGRRGKRD